MLDTGTKARVARLEQLAHDIYDRLRRRWLPALRDGRWAISCTAPIFPGRRTPREIVWQRVVECISLTGANANYTPTKDPRVVIFNVAWGPESVERMLKGPRPVRVPRLHEHLTEAQRRLLTTGRSLTSNAPAASSSALPKG